MLLLYAFIEFVQGSPALSILSFGLVLGNSKEIGKILKLKRRIKIEESILEFNSQISFFVKTFFFALIGLLLVIEPISLGIGIVIALALLGARHLAVRLALQNEKSLRKDLSLVGWLMPRGLAAAVLAIMPAQAGIPGTEQFPSIVFTVIIATIILTTLGFFMSTREKK